MYRPHLRQVPYAVCGRLINKLASSAYLEIGRIFGVSFELGRLRATLESIQPVLSVADQKQAMDDGIMDWVRRFDRVLHEADDLLDGLAIEDLRRKVNTRSRVTTKVRDFFSFKNPLAKLASEIENIQNKFNAIADDMSMLKLSPSSVVLEQNKSAWMEETNCFVLQSTIIGRKKDKSKIIELLKQSHTNQNVTSIAIVGMGGLGKTALAQMVYKEVKQQQLFQKYMWVFVPEYSTGKFVLEKMLDSLKNGAVGDLELDILQKMLQEELNGQRYLLVLDDISNAIPPDLGYFKASLMCGGKGSKILVTTRRMDLLEAMEIDSTYVLEGLTRRHSWDLLEKLAFVEHPTRISLDLVSIGREIADRCEGVPLAIKIISGLLQSKKEENEWVDILNGDFWRYGNQDFMMPMLLLSYQNLPLGLRQCFAYCSLYPRDRAIQKDELIQLWMAQGYLESSTEAETMEDLGDMYVKILLMRSFFQEPSWSKYNGITSFKMHELMHDLSKSLAGHNSRHYSSSLTSVLPWNEFDSRSKMQIIRLVRNISNFRPYREKNDFRPYREENLKYLRVLDLSRSSITNMPESAIDQLNHLKYLDISYCAQLTSLPKSIVNLVSLQTLKLCGCTELVFPTAIITKLIRLRYLDIDNCKAFEDMMPAGLGKLTSLQFLSRFEVGDNRKMKCGKLNELKDLNNVKGKLKIHNLKLVKDVATESQEANLKAKKYIQWLGLFWESDVLGKSDENQNSDSLQLLDNLCPHQNLRELTVGGYPGVQFSSWLSSLTSIVEINLVCFSSCQHLPPIERLPCLKRLYIFSMDELRYMDYEKVSEMFFLSLEKLIYVNCINLKGWKRLTAGDSANDIHPLPPFPRLSSVEIYNCPKLTCMPTYPHLIEKLELRSSNVKPMIDTCLVQLQSSSVHPLSCLKHLDIGDIDIEEIAEDWMQNLTSLQRLSLCGSSIIRPLSRHLQHLPTQLKQLDIRDIDEDLNTQTQWQAPRALHALQSITIQYCQNLKALLEWTCHIQSLRRLDIWNCPDLESLPEGMRCLTNLHTLHIQGCPRMLDRCKTETGQDWPKISHIPNIVLEN